MLSGGRLHAVPSLVSDLSGLLPVVHALPDAAGLVDAWGRLRAANAALVGFFGLRSCGLTLLQLTASEELFAACARALEGRGCALRLELPLLHRTAEVRLSPLRPGLLLLLLRDVRA